MRIMPTQAQRLIRFIRMRGRAGASYLDLLLTGISTAPHKRLAEAGQDWLKPGEKLERFMREDRVHFRIGRG